MGNKIIMGGRGREADLRGREKEDGKVGARSGMGGGRDRREAQGARRMNGMVRGLWEPLEIPGDLGL